MKRAYSGIFILISFVLTACSSALAGEAGEVVSVIQAVRDNDAMIKRDELVYRVGKRMHLNEVDSKLVTTSLKNAPKAGLILGELLAECGLQIHEKIYFLEILKGDGIIVFPAEIDDGVIKTNGDPIRYVGLEDCSSVILKAIESFNGNDNEQDQIQTKAKKPVQGKQPE